VDDTFDIVGMDIMRNSSEEGTVLHMANRPRRLTERLSEIESDRDTLNAHMQGATNFNGETFEDNCDNSHPLSNRIYVPQDVVEVNKFELSFTRESFRGYTESTADESSHTHDVELNPEINGTRFFNHNHEVDVDDSNGEHATGAQLIVPANTDFNPGIQHTSTQIGTAEFEIPLPSTADSNDVEEILFELEIANFGDSGDNFSWIVENERNDEVIDFDEYIDSNEVYNFTAEISADDSDTFYAEPGETLTYRPTGGEFDHSSSRDATDKKSYVKIRAMPKSVVTNSPTTDSKLGSAQTQTSQSGSKHNHGVNYGIFEPSSEENIDIEVRVDGNLVTTITDVSVGQEVSTPIDLKGSLSEPIAGNYHNVELVPIERVSEQDKDNSRCRLSANVVQKVFIESKL